MKSKGREVVELEAELLRLNTLVRARRAQLAKLADCPNKSCECRKVWREVVEDKLATQVGKIRKSVSLNGKASGKAIRSRAKSGRSI